MKFAEQCLEQAIIELLEEEDCPRVLGLDIDLDSAEVLIKEDLKTLLTRQYAIDNIISGEIKSIIRKMEVFAASELCASNKTIFESPGERNEQYL